MFSSELFVWDRLSYVNLSYLSLRKRIFLSGVKEDFFLRNDNERHDMTDTIKPLTSESEQLMTKVTKDLIDSMKAFEDSFAKIQKNEKVVKPNDSNWIYAMNNFTVAMYGRLLERTDWHFEQRNKFKQQAEKVVSESGSSSFPAEMAQKNRVLYQSYEIAYQVMKEFTDTEHYYKSWDDIPKDTNVSEVQPKHIKEYNQALGL